MGKSQHYNKSGVGKLATNYHKDNSGQSDEIDAAKELKQQSNLLDEQVAFGVHIAVAGHALALDDLHRSRLDNVAGHRCDRQHTTVKMLHVSLWQEQEQGQEETGKV